MKYYFKKSISGFTYSDLVYYLATRCDLISFTVPYFDWKKDCDNPEVHDEEIQGYLDLVDDFIEDIKSYIIIDEYGCEYFGQRCSHMMRIIGVELNENTYPIFMAANEFADWKFPNRVEDLCFFSKGKCVLRSISHENVCEIYTDSDFDILLFKKMGVKILKTPLQDEGYYLDYTLSFKNQNTGDDFVS